MKRAWKNKPLERSEVEVAEERIKIYLRARRDLNQLTDRSLGEKFCVAPPTIKKVCHGYAVRALCAEDVSLVKALYAERQRLEEVARQNAPEVIASDIGVMGHWVKKRMTLVAKELFP